MTKKEIEFLKESNAIEGVLDLASLEQAKIAWEYLKAQKEITPSVILKTHKILMLHQPLYGFEKGYYRTVQVSISGHEAIDWNRIPENIELVAKSMTTNPKGWKIHHIEYEKIHPFVDGNGRTGRMFMNWERLKAGLPIKVIKASERFKYYDWFN